jgi:hypothetical protein
VSKDEKRHLDRVASLPCCLCGASPVHVHHIRESQGMAQRASNWLTVPLCPDCHQGPKGVHGDQSMLRIMRMSEMDMLADTIRRLNA